MDRDRERRRRRDRQTGREDHRRAHHRGDRGQGSPEHQARRLRAFVDSRATGRICLDPQLKTFRPADELKKIYEDRGIVPSHEVIAYCQVGMRASVDLFALHLLGYGKLRNYYGAWKRGQS